jgi:hypothetical protein
VAVSGERTPAVRTAATPGPAHRDRLARRPEHRRRRRRRRHRARRLWLLHRRQGRSRLGQGFPQRTDRGKQQVEGFCSGLATATTAPFALLPSAFAGSHGPQDVKDIYAVEQKLTETAIANPTVGHYSDAYTEHYGRMSTEATDLVSDIVSGRRKTGEWKPFWTEWRSQGLDRMARECQKSIE